MLRLHNYACSLDDDIRSLIFVFRLEFVFVCILGADEGSSKVGHGASYAHCQPYNRVAKSGIDN